MDRLSEITARQDCLAGRERELEEALANTTDVLADKHLYACRLRRADAQLDFDQHAPADIAFLLAVVAAADTLCADVKACHAYARTAYLRKDVAAYESARAALEAANG